MIDRLMMTRCIDLSKQSGRAGEYPYAAVVCQHGKVVAESTNRVTRDRDVTRHAEVVAISLAQKALNSVSLDDCEIYINAEPCVLCSYAIRESRMRRVVYGLASPHMGGMTKWNVLSDTDLYTAMPEIFAPPPEIVPGYMENEVEQALIEWNPLAARIIKYRGLFESSSRARTKETIARPANLDGRLLRFMRRNFFDHFGRR